MRRSAGSAAAAVVALAVAAVVLLGRGGDYDVRARFLDAGQLVKGNVVMVAGRRIGTVSKLDVTPDGRADVTLRIDDERYAPLHRGTRMSIRTVGLSGVANRFVEVLPGARSGPEIEDGGVVGTEATRGIVDLDMLLSAFGPATRQDVKVLLRESAKGLEGNVAAANRFLRFLDPATAQTQALLEDVTADQAAVDRLVGAGSEVAGALAARDGDVRAGIGSAAQALEAVASRRGALSATLRRAPGVLRQARGTLRTAREVVRDARPALREARPVAAPLASVLRKLVPTARAATPVLREARTLLPALAKVLGAAPGLASTAVPALRSADTAIGGAMPVFEGLREYSLDVLQGFAVRAGAVGAHYDANGHYVRVEGNFDLTRSSAGGLLEALLPDIDLPPLDKRYRGEPARCPGSLAQPPLRDGSNAPPEGGLCDPEDGR